MTGFPVRLIYMMTLCLVCLAAGCADDGGEANGSAANNTVATTTGDAEVTVPPSVADSVNNDAAPDPDSAVDAADAPAGHSEKDSDRNVTEPTLKNNDDTSANADRTDENKPGDESIEGSPVEGDADSSPEPDAADPAPLAAAELPEIEIPDIDIEAELAKLPYDDAEDLRDHIKQAYDNVETYHAEISFGIVQKAGRWDMVQRGDLHIAFDRKANALLIDKPDLRLVIKDNRMLLKSYKIAGRHMDAPAPDPLKYSDLFTQVPHVTNPHLPEVLFFFADDPIKYMVNYVRENEMELLPPEFDDPAKRPGLLIKNYAGTWTLRVDPKTHLITSAVYGGPEGGEENFKTQRWHEFDIHIKTLNKPLSKDVFSIPLADSKAVPTLRDLITGASLLNPKDFTEKPKPGAEGMGNHPLAGEAAPALNLEALEGDAFSLADAGDDAVVLIFWSSWDGKSKQGLLEIDAINQWVKKEKKSAQVFAINVRESVDDVKRYLKANEIGVPILMDKDAAVAEAFEVAGMPQIMVIKSGRIVYANRGVAPELNATIKTIVDAPPAEEKTETDPPE